MRVQGVENKKTFELSEEDVNKIRLEVEKYTTEADLVRGKAGGGAGGVAASRTHTGRVSDVGEGVCGGGGGGRERA